MPLSVYPETAYLFVPGSAKMYYLRISFVVVAMAVAFATAKTLVNDANKGEGEMERIVGGRDASPGQFPWTVALYYNGDFICTASIISPSTVMTAAHCVVLEGELQPADLFYGIANYNRMAGQVRIDFANVTPHPQYNDESIDNDIALFQTTQPIDFTQDGGPKPVCVAGPAAAQYNNATAMGWGNTQRFAFLPPNYPAILQYARMRIVPNSHCSILTPGINEDKICAKGFENFQFTGICSGDSGGPLVHLSANQPPVQIGIASYINGLAGCGNIASGVFTRVSSHLEFIVSTASDNQYICVVE